MKEILCWGDIEKEFERLNISPEKTYESNRPENEDRLTVYKLTNDQFGVMCDDEVNVNHWHSDKCHAGWRYAEGCTLGSVDTRFSVNGHWMYGWKEQDYQEKYPNVLDYICWQLGLSTERNICACSVELAKQNGLSLGEFFKKYMG